MTGRHCTWLTALALASGAMVVAPSPAAARRIASGSVQRGTPPRDDHRRFDDHDRQVVLDWYNGHRQAEPLGLRDRDRLAANVELRLTVGSILGTDLRGEIHTVPDDLLHRLPPQPKGYRYVFIGGHLCVIDGRYQVYEVIHVGH